VSTGLRRGTARAGLLTNPDSLRVLFADAHRNPTLARRPQVLSERQRVKNRSEYAFREQRGLTPHSPFVRPSLRYANGTFASQSKAKYDYLEKE